MQDFVKTLANFRKNSSAITKGKLMQYVPDDGLYVYFRYDEKQTVMCVMNTSEKDRAVDFGKFAERTKGFSKGRNVITGAELSSGFQIPAKRMWVIELNR